MAETTSTGEVRRPSPKALLELAAKDTRGKLKVFLGMAPGVGKTYAMLLAARALKALPPMSIGEKLSLGARLYAGVARGLAERSST